VSTQTKSRHVVLLEQAQEQIKSVKELDAAAQAAARELTEDEQTKRKGLMEQAQKFFDDAKAAKADATLAEQMKAFSTEIGLADLGDDGIPGAVVRSGKKSLGELVVASKSYTDFIKRYAGHDGRIPDSAKGLQSDAIGLKSLFTGTSDTSGGAFVETDHTGIVEMLGRRPLTIRDLISVRRTGSDTVDYVRQTSHTNAAAPVPEATTSAAPTAPGTAGALVQAAGGGYKPEGAWAFERDSATVKTIAEWVPATKRSLADVAQLEGLINDELAADLAETEENQILSGDGTGENLAGILHTSGTQAQTFSTDIFETTRKAITKARTVGRVVPNAIGLNPTDQETIDLARDGNDRFFGAGPFAFGPKTLWGYPTFESEAIPAGTGIVADWSKAVLWDREQATVTMTDSHADFFTRNLVAILAEERVAFAVTRPTAFVIADLTA